MEQTEEQKKRAMEDAGLNPIARAGVLLGADTSNILGSNILGPQPEIKLPLTNTDTTNYQGIMAGGKAETDSYTKLLDDYLSRSTPSVSLAEEYKAALGESGTDPLSQDVVAQQKAANVARDKLATINARLEGLAAESKAIPIAVQQESEGRGRTAAGVAPLTTARLRENALRALPLQAQAIAALAEVQAAQGDLELSQGTLRLAQDKLDTVFQLRSKDVENQYNYKKELRGEVYEFATGAEKRRLDALQKEADRELELLKDSINNAQDLAKLAIENGQAGLAAQITSLDPKSKTFKQDLARLSGQIRTKVDTKGTTESGGLIYTAQDASEDSRALEKSRGIDGYVDPAIYQKLYTAWVGAGGLLKDFLKKFPPKNYVNPANETLPSFLMPPKSSTVDFDNL